MILLDGKKTATDLKNKIKLELDALYKKGLPRCNLYMVLVGCDPASEVYVRNKTASCAEVGIGGVLIRLPETATQSEVESVVKELAVNDEAHGILVQLPLPEGLDGNGVTALVPPEKDVDGFTAQSLGALVTGEEGFLSCTPGGIVYMLKSYGVNLSGKHAVVIGRSKIVGKPMALALLNEDCTVTVCHRKTERLKEICLSADLIVVAVKSPCFLKADMVKDGAIVVDVGINRTENGLKGDVDFDGVSAKCSYISPVPGGVGPMTVAYLINNTFEAYKKSLGIK